MIQKKNGFLWEKHPTYVEMEDTWRELSRRLRGGRGVMEELTRFDWELENGPHYLSRQKKAVYLNFPDRFAALMVGHLMRQAPEPGHSLSFGSLGEVRRLRDMDRPTRAELLYYNTNGVGADGSQWDNYWNGVIKSSIGLGHRWILVEGPPEAPGNRFREQWLRPVVTDYSPLQVLNWYHEAGQLQMAVIHRYRRSLRLNAEGGLEGNKPELEVLLLTAEGFNGFGSEFSDGGWFIFDQDGELTDRFGFYEATDGQIPMSTLFYERLNPDDDEKSEYSRSGIHELGNAAIAYMDLCSAADFDAFDGAASVQALLGVDEEGFNLFIAKMKEGNRFAPVPPNKDTGHNPTIFDASTGAVVADVFDRRLKAKREEAIELMLNEIHSAPYASGESKQIGFTDGKAPRLAVLASEVESAQNTVIHFTEMMWGARNPSGSVEWAREFELRDVEEQVRRFFEAQNLAGVKSPTATALAMDLLVRNQGLTGDTVERQKIKDEYLENTEKTVGLELAPPPKPASGPAVA